MATATKKQKKKKKHEMKMLYGQQYICMRGKKTTKASNRKVEKSQIEIFEKKILRKREKSVAKKFNLNFYARKLCISYI